MRISSFVFSILAMMAVPLLGAVPAFAASPTRTINLDISEGRLITLPGPAASVFVADPAIADVQVPQSNRIFIFGKKTGQTTLYALADTGRQLAVYTVSVHLPVGSTQQGVSDTAGGGDTKVTSTETNVLVQGTAPDPATAAKITNRVAGDFPTKDQVDTSALSVSSSAQVMLRVWVGEVSRTVTKDLGVNLTFAGIPGLGTFRLITGRQAFPLTTAATGGNTTGAFNDQTTGRGELTYPPNDFGSLVAGFASGRAAGNAVIDALATEGLVTTLAEPTLTALTGQTASFLAGGEFPIPTSSGLGTTTIEFQTYGVSLSFVPTVLASNRISLKVAPEVSELSTAGEVDANGFEIPGLTVRRAQTTVELGSGESMSIAGLLQNTTSTTIEKYPGLGDLPVLGALFRSNNFQRGETELVIIITPYLVHGVDNPNTLLLPTDGMKPPTDLERIFRGRMAEAVGGPTSDSTSVSAVSALTAPRLTGDAGFDLE